MLLGRVRWWKRDLFFWMGTPIVFFGGGVNPFFWESDPISWLLFLFCEAYGKIPLSNPEVGMRGMRRGTLPALSLHWRAALP